MTLATTIKKKLFMGDSNVELDDPTWNEVGNYIDEIVDRVDCRSAKIEGVTSSSERDLIDVTHH